VFEFARTPARLTALVVPPQKIQSLDFTQIEAADQSDCNLEGRVVALLAGDRLWTCINVTFNSLTE
jgi:hypothetical protein